MKNNYGKGGDHGRSVYKPTTVLSNNLETPKCHGSWTKLAIQPDQL